MVEHGWFSCFAFDSLMKMRFCLAYHRVHSAAGLDDGGMLVEAGIGRTGLGWHPIRSSRVAADRQ